MNCKGCGFWKSDMDPQAGEEIHRCACDSSPRLDDETAAEDECEYGVPPIEDVLRWLDHRLQGTLMPGAERMYRAMRYYLEEATALSTLQGENEKLRAELERVKQKYSEASEAICSHCTDVPCRGENCYWWCGPKKED